MRNESMINLNANVNPSGIRGNELTFATQLQRHSQHRQSEGIDYADAGLPDRGKGGMYWSVKTLCVIPRVTTGGLPSSSDPRPFNVPVPPIVSVPPIAFNSLY